MHHIFPRRAAAVLAAAVLTVSPLGLRAATINDALAAADRFDYRASLSLLQSLPSDSYDRRHLAWARLRAGEPEKAIALFLAVTPSDYEVQFGLGLASFLREDLAGAAGYFRKTLEVNKHCAAAEYLLGEIARRENRTDDALVHYRAALKLDYNLVEARPAIARLIDSLGRPNDAYREWAKLADIDPKYGEAGVRKKALLAKITRKPEELVPPRRITDSLRLTAVERAETVPKMRIGIVKDGAKAALWSKEGIAVYDGGKKILQTAPGKLLEISMPSKLFRSGGRYVLKPVNTEYGIVVHNIRYAEGFAWGGVSDREYRGTFELNCGARALTLVNIVNLEEYLYSVLPSEMISWWPEEALKVQAVIARTQAVYRRDTARLHRSSGFDLCATQHCQVYSGTRSETVKARRATDATRGEILVYDGKPVHTLFSSNCSGHTQSSRDLDGWGDEPFLAGVPDGECGPPKDRSELDRWIKHPPAVFCAPSKYTYYAESRWMRVVSQDDLAEMLNRRFKLGRIRKIVPVKRSPSGHINGLTVTGTAGETRIDREHIIRSIVLGRIRSTNFIVEGFGDAGGVPQYFVFWGAGWGHAVGLCQSGVAGMAEKNYAYGDILRQYYRNTSLKKVEY